MIVKTIRLSVGPKSTQEGVRLLLDIFGLDSLRRSCGETVRHWTRRFTLQYWKVGQAVNTSNSEISKTFEVSCWLKHQVSLQVSLHVCWPRVVQKTLSVKALATVGNPLILRMLSVHNRVMMMMRWQGETRRPENLKQQWTILTCLVSQKLRLASNMFFLGVNRINKLSLEIFSFIHALMVSK